MPQGVLLVGSIPLTSSRDVFDIISRDLRTYVLRIPDGETGVRKDFMEWQEHVFPEEVRAAYIRKDKSPGPGPEEYDFRIENIKATEYDQVAISSYHEFRELRDQGIIPTGVRFQVSLPTPLCVIASRVDARYQAVAEPCYEQRMIETLQRLQNAIPACDLAVQWDVALDIALLEFNIRDISIPKPFFSKPWFSPVREGIIQRITRMAKYVKADVEMGYHLCYGDKFRKHFIEPLDLGLLTDLANDISKNVEPIRPINWFHMPVPRNRKDPEYFQPLTRLRVVNAELFLGLVHIDDQRGSEERINTAQRVYRKPFGVATECGLGRATPDELKDVLKIFKAVTDTY